MKNLRSRWDRVYHDSLQKIEGHKRQIRDKLGPKISTASRLTQRTLRYGVQEILSTVSVTTYHPMGWSWQYFRERVETKIKGPVQPCSDLQLNSPILLIHGISHNSSAFYRFKSTAKKRGFKKIKTLELFTTLKDISTMSQQLIAEIEATYKEHKKTYGQGKVRIIAHSLGGMVLRSALLHKNIDRYVDRVIFLGVPHQGNFFYNFPVFRCIRELSPGSSLMKKIKTTPLPGNIDYWNLRGMLDVVTPGRDTFLPSVPNLNFVNVGHAGLLTDGRVIETILSILQEDAQE